MEDNKKVTPPKAYYRFKEKYPEIANKYEALGTTIHESGPLTERERALVKLAISGGNLYHSAFKAHIKKALNAGLTRTEIEQVVLLMLPTLGFPRMMAAMSILESQFEREDQ